MDRVGRFEKVSREQFKNSMKLLFGEQMPDGNLTNDAVIDEMYENIKLPVRATFGSAGYDFHIPFSLRLLPGESIRIPTGVRVYMEDGWWLSCIPRSGLGAKYRLQLDNTIGVIDADYYYSDNEGHIFAKITNDTYDNKTVCLSAGDRFMQAIFLPFGITTDDKAAAKRNGGFGSTNY